MLPSRRRRGTTEFGQELVEFALVLPILLLLLLGIMELGRVVFAYNSVALAAREGARAGVIASATDADIIRAALDRAPALGLAPGNIRITRSGDTIQVQVSHDVSLITAPVIQALGGNAVIHLQTTSTMRKE